MESNDKYLSGVVDSPMRVDSWCASAAHGVPTRSGGRPGAGLGRDRPVEAGRDLQQHRLGLALGACMVGTAEADLVAARSSLRRVVGTESSFPTGP